MTEAGATVRQQHASSNAAQLATRRLVRRPAASSWRPTHLRQQHHQRRGKRDGAHNTPQRAAVAHIGLLPRSRGGRCRAARQAAQPAAAAAAAAGTAQQQGQEAAPGAAAATLCPLAALAVVGAVALQQRAADHACAAGRREGKQCGKGCKELDPRAGPLRWPMDRPCTAGSGAGQGSAGGVLGKLATQPREAPPTSPPVGSMAANRGAEARAVKMPSRPSGATPIE